MKAGIAGDRPFRRQHSRRRVHARTAATPSHAPWPDVHSEPHAPTSQTAWYSWPTTEADRPIDRDGVLGLVLERLRVGAGLTCGDAGSRSGLGASRVIGLEEGDGLLLFTDAVPLAEAYGSSVTELASLLERAIAEARRDRKGS